MVFHSIGNPAATIANFVVTAAMKVPRFRVDDVAAVVAADTRADSRL